MTNWKVCERKRSLF